MVRLPLALLSLSISLAPALRAQIPSPKEFLGHDIGEDHFLANYTQLRAYWTELDQRSDRMVVETFGETSYGQPMVMAVISSPANLARLDAIRGANARLASGRDEDRAAATTLAAQNPAIIWIDAGMHATESIAGQNIIELAYRMTSRDDAEVKRILDQVVLLVVPANPDGLELVANAYMASQRVGNLPVLYQRYIGHDNNRDYYAANQKETRAICRMLYHRWLPQVVYNHHQSAPRGTVIFTPPFRDPFNYNLDPIVTRGIDLVAAHMNQRFAREGKPGVISRTGARYSGWWNGGLRTTTPFHNMIGILTESFGNPNPSPLEQTLDRRVPFSDYPDPVATQTWHARQTIEYLQTANFAILDYASRFKDELRVDQWQMARNSIQRGSKDHWTATPKLHELAKASAARAAEATDRRAAESRESRETGDAAEGEQRGGRRNRGERTEGGDTGDTGDSGDNAGRGERGERARGDAGAGAEVFADPALRDARVYVLPADGRNFTAAVRMVRALRHTAVEVHRATKPVTAGDRTYPAGSFFLFAAQAFRPHLRDMFEPQWHPDIVGANGQPEPPYDAAGWTLALQQEVDFVRLLDDDVARDALEPVLDVDVAFAQQGIAGTGGAGFIAPHDEINVFLAANRLLAAGDELCWIAQPFDSGARRYNAGALFVRAGKDTEARVARAAQELGVPFARIDAVPPGETLPLRKPRIGLFDVWGGNMATGWTEWALKEHGFDVELVFAPRVNEGALREKFDVLVFHTGLPAATGRDRVESALRRERNPSEASSVDKVLAALPAFEDWSKAPERRERLDAAKAISALQAFVAEGGTLIALEDQATRAIKHFDLAIDDGVWVTPEGAERRRAKSTEFFVPGSLVWLDVAADEPVGFGCAPRLAAMFERSEAYTVRDAERDPRVHVVASYAAGDVLASGWIRGADLVGGKVAALRADVGKGRLYLFGADMVYRGQPLGTLKMLMNAVLTPR